MTLKANIFGMYYNHEHRNTGKPPEHHSKSLTLTTRNTNN